jgi:hypothetical protein
MQHLKHFIGLLSFYKRKPDKEYTPGKAKNVLLFLSIPDDITVQLLPLATSTITNPPA